MWQLVVAGVQAQLLSAAAPSVEPPQFVGRWALATQSLPAIKLPQNPLLGNGHVGILLDSRITSPQSGPHAVFDLHNATRCGSSNGWPLIGTNLSLEQCETNCTASARCAAFSYCDEAAGGTGCAVPTAGITSRCFQFPNMNQCEGGQVGWTSGLREPSPAPPPSAGPSNVTLDLWVGSNSLWAVNACPPATHDAHRQNTNRSAPFNPHWAPPFAPACAQRMALGGLSLELPARGAVALSMEQHIGHPRLQAAVSSELGNFTLVAYLHPVENTLVVNISASAATAVTVSTWALNSTASPSRTVAYGPVGTVTRQAVAAKPPFTLHNSIRCGSDNGWPLIGTNLSLEQCEANCTASARCGAFSYCNATAGATGCATAGFTSRCFPFSNMSRCEGSQDGWISGLKTVQQRPKTDKQIVAVLATASASINRWTISATADGYKDGQHFGARTIVSSAVSLVPADVVTIFTAFADNSLMENGSDVVAAAVAITKLVTSRVTTAVAAGTTAATVSDAGKDWWHTFWQQSSIRLPTRPAIERYWFGAQYILGSMASTNPRVPAPGLFGPWATSDTPAWEGAYTASLLFTVLRSSFAVAAPTLALRKAPMTLRWNV
jgi:hypothetical protein